MPPAIFPALNQQDLPRDSRWSLLLFLDIKIILVPHQTRQSVESGRMRIVYKYIPRMWREVAEIFGGEFLEP